MTVLGSKVADFKNKDGETIQYGKLYASYPDEKVNGLACEAIAVKPELLKDIQAGDEIEILYNKYGKVQSIVPAR